MSEYFAMPESGFELAHGYIRVAHRLVTEPHHDAFRYDGPHRLRALEGFLGLKPGTWVVKNAWGRLEVMDDVDFRRIYKEVSDG